jgi:hypothetical protein
MLVLESSSKEQESCDIILDSENIHFTDNHCLHQFATETFCIMLLAATIDHECLRNKLH